MSPFLSFYRAEVCASRRNADFRRSFPTKKAGNAVKTNVSRNLAATVPIAVVAAFPLSVKTDAA